MSLIVQNLFLLIATVVDRWSSVAVRTLDAALSKLILTIQPILQDIDWDSMTSGGSSALAVAKLLGHVVLPVLRSFWSHVRQPISRLR